MKKALSLLFAVSVYCSFTAMPVLAGETIVYDGSDTSMLQNIGGMYNSLAPSGSSTGKSNSLSGNSITVSSNVAGEVYGAINVEDTDATTGNSVTINGGTVDGSIYGSNASFGNATGNSVIVNGGTVISDLLGGYSAIGNATGNSVTITSGTVISDVSGGASDEGNAIGNILTINGGTVNGNVYGAWSESGNATGNSVTITSGTVDTYAYGGCSDTGNAIGNILTINGGTLSDNVHGGCSDSSGDATDNIVTINGGALSKDVFGGYTAAGNATNNIVTITSGTVGGSVHGGRSSSGDVTDNIMTINGGTVGTYAYGGRSNTGNVTGNSLIINGGTLKNNVHGGCSDVSGDATDNILTINGGTLSGNVYGGYTREGNAIGNSVTINGGTVNGNVYGGWINLVSGNATNNTVTIYSSVSTNSVIYGGKAGAGKDARTGNTFNVMGFNTVKGIQNFENYNFCLPDNVSNGNGILWVTDGDGFGNQADITNSKISISGSEKVTLHENDTIFLIYTGSGINAVGINTETTALFGISKFYEFEIGYGNIPGFTYLYATYTGKSRVNPQTKILSEGAAAGAILAGQGADNINGGLLSGLQEGKVEMFGSFFGGSSKYDTGSSVEMSVFGAAAGIGKKFGSFDAGAFIEYANGSFDTEYNGLKGDGEVSAIGAGILAKKDIKEDIYVEGLIRAGQVSNDYKSKIVDGMGILVNTDFDYSAIYFGISLGGGKIFKVSEKVNVDAFAKYALTNTGGGEATLSNDDKYEFDSILSNRIKAGAKGEYKINEKFTPYLALSYDYELSGDVDAKINGDKVESPTLNGGTFSGGLGLNTKVSEKLTLDLSANVYSGVREGVIGSLQVKYEF